MVVEWVYTIGSIRSKSCRAIGSLFLSARKWVFIRSFFCSKVEWWRVFVQMTCLTMLRIWPNDKFDHVTHLSKWCIWPSDVFRKVKHFWGLKFGPFGEVIGRIDAILAKWRVLSCIIYLILHNLVMRNWPQLYWKFFYAHVILIRKKFVKFYEGNYFKSNAIKK